VCPFVVARVNTAVLWFPLLPKASTAVGGSVVEACSSFVRKNKVTRLDILTPQLSRHLCVLLKERSSSNVQMALTFLGLTVQP
jgi:hypothetical protein